MSNSHRTSCEFLKDIFGRISGADSGADGRRHAYGAVGHTWPRLACGENCPPRRTLRVEALGVLLGRYRHRARINGQV